MTNVAALQNQLVHFLAEDTLEQMESFDKTVQIFQEGLGAIEENVKSHAAGMATLLVQTASLEGRADQLNIKVQTQEELQTKQKNALSERLKEMAATTSRLQNEMNYNPIKSASDAKDVAHYEKNYDSLFKEINESIQQQALAGGLLKINCQDLEKSVQELSSISFSDKTTSIDKLEIMDKGIETLTYQYNSHWHAWGTYNDFTRCSYTNNSSGPTA